MYTLEQYSHILIHTSYFIFSYVISVLADVPQNGRLSSVLFFLLIDGLESNSMSQLFLIVRPKLFLMI